MKRGADFNNFWKSYLLSGNRNLLYVLGRGFDPRMCIGFGAILGAGGYGVRNCLVIEFDEGPDSPSRRHISLVEKNLKILKNLIQFRGEILTKSVRMWSGDGPGRRRVGSRNAAAVFWDISDLENYTDIVIDISAMPRGIYFSLIGKILYLLDHAKKNDQARLIPNLHVVVSENVRLDKKIRDVGIDDNASYVHGFGRGLEMEATEGIPKVWIPILGEGQRGQLERIYTLVNPDEICPVFPSPSLNPRRGDELLIEYRELLFDQWRIEPKNIIYASEQNPFEAYRQIHRTVCHYNRSLGPLGGCKSVISAVSSKLLSIGALLAVYELKETGMSVGLAHVEAQGYEIDEIENVGCINDQVELFTLWLAGDCYE
ncbi:MAG: hypothetical protein K6U04_07100 [Armatimonadetes bacterium]|nr:hypothetical protein [Armatimonadota bacterium]